MLTSTFELLTQKSILWWLAQDCQRRLLQVDPSNEVGLRSSAFALVMMKRFAEAISPLELAQEQLHQIKDDDARAAVREKLERCSDLCRKRVAPPADDFATEGQLFTDEGFVRDFLEERKLKFPSTAHLKNLGGATKDDK
eukprot:4890752-Amphidinium_carterae.2